MQTPNFDGSASRAVVRRQFDTVAEQSYWTPRETAALNKSTVSILHGIPTSATHEEVTTTWKRGSSRSWKEEPD